MPRQVFDFDPPERFVAGTVGQPGQRTFFLQARSGPRVTSVACEKGQVAALAQRVAEMLDEVVRRSGGAAPVPAITPVGSEDVDPLDTPVEEEFRVGTMSLVWDGERDRVVIECFEVGEEPDGPDEDPEPDAAAAGGAVEPGADDVRSVLRVTLTGAGARAFCQRSMAVVAAGRPPCPFCAGPLDPEGHICPRSNGYKR